MKEEESREEIGGNRHGYASNGSKSQESSSPNATGCFCCRLHKLPLELKTMKAEAIVMLDRTSIRSLFIRSQISTISWLAGCMKSNSFLKSTKSPKVTHKVNVPLALWTRI